MAHAAIWLTGILVLQFFLHKDVIGQDTWTRFIPLFSVDNDA